MAFRNALPGGLGMKDVPDAVPGRTEQKLRIGLSEPVAWNADDIQRACRALKSLWLTEALPEAVTPAHADGILLATGALLAHNHIRNVGMGSAPRPLGPEGEARGLEIDLVGRYHVRPATPREPHFPSLKRKLSNKLPSFAGRTAVG